MFPELNKYINEEIEPTVESTREFLNKLNGARRRVRNKINKSEEQVKRMNNEIRYVASLKPEIQRGALKISKDILYNKFLSAIRTNKEFDTDEYRLALVTAIEDSDTYLVRITGAGFNSKVSVDINLDKTAGRLQMWGDAIKAVRRELGTKVPRKDAKNYRKRAIAASMAWKRLYEGGSTSATVKSRLAVSAKVAPFWSILNFGTPPVGGMSSERGGFATPKNKSTNFVNEAEEEIKSSVVGIFDTAKERFEETYSEYNKFLDEEQAVQQRLDEMAEQIRLDRAQVKKLQAQLQKEGAIIDSNKLEKAVEDVRKNLSDKRIFEVGATGSRKRISRSTIEEFLNG